MKASKRARHRSFVAGLLGASLLALAATPGTAAEPGQLDRSFSRDGVRYLDFGRYDSATAIFGTASGRLVLAGDTNRFPAGLHRLAITRLEPDGRLDRSFGKDGRVLLNPTSRDDPAIAWARDPDGRIVVLGTFDDSTSEYYLMRFCANGSIDRSFGVDGIVTGRLGGDFSLVNDILVQAGGRILVVADVDGAAVIKAHRQDGSRARGYGASGRVSISANSGSVILEQARGRTLVVGQVNGQRVVIDALAADGRRDPSFGGDGRAALRIDHENDEFFVETATVLPDDSVAVAGEIGFFESDTFVARFQAEGSRDAAFGGGDSWTRFDVGKIDISKAIVALPNGRLVVAGSVIRDRFGDDRSARLSLVGLRPGGGIWRGFGNGGVVRADFGARRTFAEGAELIDGKVVVVGVSRTDMFAARYLVRAE